MSLVLNNLIIIGTYKNKMKETSKTSSKKSKGLQSKTKK